MPRKRQSLPRDGAEAPWGMLSDNQIRSIDQAVGAQVRMRRMMLGLSQERVAKTLDLTFQQLQKYERGLNRISASRLYQLATVLNVPVSFFFETVNVGAQKAAPGNGAEIVTSISAEQMRKPRTRELVRAFYAIGNERTRGAALSLLKSMARSE